MTRAWHVEKNGEECTLESVATSSCHCSSSIAASHTMSWWSIPGDASTCQMREARGGERWADEGGTRLGMPWWRCRHVVAMSTCGVARRGPRVRRGARTCTTYEDGLVSSCVVPVPGSRFCRHAGKTDVREAGCMPHLGLDAKLGLACQTWACMPNLGCMGLYPTPVARGRRCA